ncbi:hypothetical protein [Pseudomonas sp. BF-R-19]|nr:hypothetical protein [Pseudomonas sp. BF-R-19]
MLHAFNTGRQYTAKGQRIAYIEVTRDADEFVPISQVVFYDMDRHIDS